MITVKMVRDKGFKFVEGDITKGSVSGVVKPMSEAMAFKASANCFTCCGLVEFAWRETEGAMPCDGELLVDVRFVKSLTLHTETNKARDVDWTIARAMGDGLKWRPSMKNWKNEKMESEVKNLNLSKIHESSEWKCGDLCRVDGTKFDKIRFVGLSENPAVAICECFSGLAVTVDTFLVVSLEKIGVCEESESVDSAHSGDVEWTTELLPPIGSKCVYFVANMSDYPTENHMRQMTCVAHVGGHDGLVDNGLAVLVSDDFSFSTVCNESWIRKPETPEQREEREAMWLAYELYCAANNEVGNKLVSFNAFKDNGSINFKFWVAAAKRAKELLAK